MGRATTELLRREGYAVVWRATLDGARRSLAEPGPDIVLLDLGLRTESGTELLHASDFERAPPIIIVSAQPESDCRKAAQAVSACAVLRKPYQADDLLLAVRNALKTGS